MSDRAETTEADKENFIEEKPEEEEEEEEEEKEKDKEKEKKGLHPLEILSLWGVKFGVNLRQRFVFVFLPALSRSALHPTFHDNTFFFIKYTNKFDFIHIVYILSKMYC